MMNQFASQKDDNAAIKEKSPAPETDRTHKIQGDARKNSGTNPVTLLTKALASFPKTHFIHDKKSRHSMNKVQSPKLPTSRSNVFSPQTTKVSEPKRYIGTFFTQKAKQNKSFQLQKA